MSGRKPGRKRRRAMRSVRRPHMVRVIFEPFMGQFEIPDMLVVRMGALCNSHRRGTVVSDNAWLGVRVNFDTIKPGNFVKALTSNAEILRGQVIGNRIKDVVPIKERGI